MSANPFDTLGMYDNNLDGLFKKIKGAVKKVWRPAEKLGSKIRDKTLPPRVAKELSRAAQNPYVKAAAMAVATVYTGGLAAAAMGSTASTALSAKTIAMTAIKGAAKEGVKRQAGKAIAGRMMRKQESAIKKQESILASQVAARQAKLIEINAAKASKNAQEIAKSPEFKELVNKMKDAGATPQKIANTWAQSETFKDVVIQNAANTVYPQLLADYKKAGLPDADAEGLAKADALKMGAQAADAASVKANPWPKFGTIVIPVAAALLFGA